VVRRQHQPRAKFVKPQVARKRTPKKAAYATPVPAKFPIVKLGYLRETLQVLVYVVRLLQAGPRILSGALQLLRNRRQFGGGQLPDVFAELD